MAQASNPPPDEAAPSSVEGVKQKQQRRSRSRHQGSLGDWALTPDRGHGVISVMPLP